MLRVKFSALQSSVIQQPQLLVGRASIAPLTIEQGWAINFSKGPHEKLGRLQRAVGRVYGGGGGV